MTVFRKPAARWMRASLRSFGSDRIEHYAWFLLAMALFGVGHGMFLGVQDNYLAWLGIGKAGRGVVEFFREMPGLMLMFLLALFHRMAERHILKASMAIGITGVVGILLVGSEALPAVVFLVVFNIGDHLIMPVRQSYAVHAAEPGREGRALGFMRGLENLGRVLGLMLVSGIFLIPAVQVDRDGGGRLGYVAVYLTVIAFFAAAIAATLGLRRSAGSLERRRLHIHPKYRIYYILEMFYGARKQVFLTFAPYLLILSYGAGAEYIAGLLGLCALINIAFNPVIGRIIDRLGYRTVMIGDTILLFFVCLIYGFAHRLFDSRTAFIVISAAFVLDRMLSNASMAASVYVGRISDDRDEMTTTLSTGLSINHLVSILIALAGGFIWEHVGVELLFSLAAAMAVGNSLFAATVPKVERDAAI